MFVFATANNRSGGSKLFRKRLAIARGHFLKVEFFEIICRRLVVAFRERARDILCLLDPGKRMRIPLLILCAAIILLGLYSAPIRQFLAEVAAGRI